ncbi:DUF1223 domain-containing protein [Mesorhizobium xinjiangense]|uniref:DUF1223 domain-containing protein n=1 Tax=Mesorhizobium xinjiangense TaxID=2678685 RepID=UPI0012ECD15F|nr:DUF1223 domain-containing protein [Mesorhizobium xinjiangense]
MELGRPFRTAASAAAVLLVCLAAPGMAQENRPSGVVELFTSQGCSSCPRADAYLDELARSGDLVALSYHVDYWDYLGWRDTLGSADNTARQSEYGRSFGLRSIYTPQAVINGRMHMSGAKRQAVASALDHLPKAGKGLSVELAITENAESLVIEAGESPTGPQKANVLLVFFHPLTTVKIARGENAGRTITYRNSVTGFQSAGMWHGKRASYEIPASEIMTKGGAGCAVLLQSVDRNGNPGPILGAAILETPGS